MEMEHRGYKPAQQWYCPEYRGKIAVPWPSTLSAENYLSPENLIYPEHNDAYREECLTNLRQKGIELF